jgi:membrane protease YdiL (CAAX protease family)
MALIFVAQFIGAGLVVAVLAGMGIDVTSGDGPLPLPVLFAVLPVSWLAMVGWPWWVSRTKGTGSLARDFGVAIRWVDVLVGVGVGLVALVVAAAVALVFSAVSGETPPTNTDIVSVGPSQPGMLLLLFVFIAIGTPIAEEIFFRGLVLGATRKRWGTTIGVITSAVFFGAWHIQDTLAGWAFVGGVTAAYGVLFALSRVWCEGRIGAAIVAHIVVNGVTVLVVGFSQAALVLPW